MTDVPALVQHIGFRESPAGSSACISRTGFKVRVLVELHLVEGFPLDELERDYGLTRAEIHAALAYYYDHKESIDREIAELDALDHDIQPR